MNLAAGALSALYEEGELKDIRWRDQPVLSRLYGAVRDENWRTLEGSVTLRSATSERIEFTVRHAPFVWEGIITLDENGSLSFVFDGAATEDFRRNRIGFCLLHPLECVGADVVIEHVNGTHSESRFPERVCPDQPVLPFAELRALTQTLPDGSRLKLSFLGDIFELEDQRNWTDASFKTFCTPLRLPYPVVVAAGERVHQEIRIEPLSPDRETIGLRKSGPPARQISGQPGGLLLADRPFQGRVGVGHAAWSEPPDEAEIERLRALTLAHLRVDLHLDGSAAWEEHLREAQGVADRLGVPLELAVFLSQGASTRPLRHVAAKLGEARPARVLAFPETQTLGAPPPYDALAEATRDAFGDTPLFLGTDSDFIFVNRFPPPMDLCDGLTFALNPQAHAFDEASIIETVRSYPAVLKTARELSGGKPVIVSPLTLLPRWNPYAATPRPRTDEPPSDPRQSEALGARWFSLALDALEQGDIASVTVAETVGKRGILLVYQGGKENQ